MKEQKDKETLCCPYCGAVVIIDEDNDHVRCSYCKATWESFTSFEDELED